MATIDSLANETLCKIMGMLKEPLLEWSLSLPPGRYNALRAAALVCSRWRDPAQRALYDEVEISDRYPLRAERFFTFIVEADSQRVLASCLDIFPTFRALKSFSWNGYDDLRPLKASDLENLHTILDAFPSPATLTHLSIGTNDFSSFEHITPLLRHPTLSLLTKLDFPFLPASAPIEQASAVAAMAKACEDRNICLSMGGAEA
ncbi:hypothetical protein RQP46_009740 [Phenoliferia psychrophenolica]